MQQDILLLLDEILHTPSSNQPMKATSVRLPLGLPRGTRLTLPAVFGCDGRRLVPFGSALWVQRERGQKQQLLGSSSKRIKRRSHVPERKCQKKTRVVNLA